MSKEEKEMKYIVNEIMSLLEKMSDTNLDPDFCAYMLLNSGMALSLSNNDGDTIMLDNLVRYAKTQVLFVKEEILDEGEVDGTVH